MYTIDFETEKIIDGSPKTPKPVGLSVKYGKSASKYYAFGHKIGNNCTKDDVFKILFDILRHSTQPIICHNAKFDLRVCLEHFDLPIPIHPERINDTMIMAYLVDPREASLALKPLAEKYCGLEPEERDELKAWILISVPDAKPSNWGEFISYAPGSLVGKYAEADTDMTYALYEYFSPLVLIDKVEDHQNIRDAYEREIKLLPIVIDMERRGITISDDVHKALANAERQFDLCDLQLSAYANGAKPGTKAMFNVLRSKGLIDESKIVYTDKGNPRYGKEFIEDLISDKELSKCLRLRSKLQKFIGTYLRPFAESHSIYGGKFYPYYNQTRSDNDLGTRTGRFSSNIQQLPKDTGDNTTLYAKQDFTIEAMPSIRTFIIPSSKGKVLNKRDFSGQELRVTAHYAEGSILEAYKANPRMDVHGTIDNMIIEKTGHHLERTPVKTISFLKLYGGGPHKLAERLKISLQRAKEFFAAYDKALPEFKGLMKDIEELARCGTKIRTWGGRSYAVEEPKLIVKPNGQKYIQEFYYKLGNVLIQGSSADMTKEAMIRYFYHPHRKGDILLTVHDELVTEVDEEYADEDMAILKWAMDDIPGWDVPLRSDGSRGYNFANMEKLEDDD